MGFFSGTFEHRIDRKGRVSIPARWRPLLKGELHPGVFASALPDLGCIECFSQDSMTERRADFQARKELPEGKRRIIGFRLFSGYRETPLDTDGRIVLASEILEGAGFLTPGSDRSSRGHALAHTTAVLAGSGDRFLIFRPDAIAVFEELSQRENLDAGIVEA